MADHDDQINSRVLESHYRRSKNQAIAFLFTIGAKALVLAEQTGFQRESFRGCNEEAELKKEIINEELIRQVKRKFSEKEGVLVNKRSRKGETRPILLRIKTDIDKKVSTFVWRSKYKRRKTFVVDKEKGVRAVKPAELDGRLRGSSNHTRPLPPSPIKHVNKFGFDPCALPYVRFQNKDRHLDLQFRQIQDLEACMEIFQVDHIDRS